MAQSHLSVKQVYNYPAAPDVTTGALLSPLAAPNFTTVPTGAVPTSAIIDVIALLTENSIPRRYWADSKKQLLEIEGYFQLYDDIVQLKLESTDGKKYSTDCANTETLFRIIQSIPPPNLSPLVHLRFEGCPYKLSPDFSQTYEGNQQ